MEIKTKFNIGDKVWTIKACELILMTITAVCITNSGIAYSLSYENGLTCENCYHYAPEEELFVEKQQLIDRITDGNKSM